MEKEKMPRAECVEYPFPIREGQLAYFKVPIDLKKEELEKIYIYLLSLILPEETK